MDPGKRIREAVIGNPYSENRRALLEQAFRKRGAGFGMGMLDVYPNLIQDI